MATARLRAVAIYGPGAGVFAGTPCPEVGVPHTEAAGGFHPRRAADAGWEPSDAGAGSTGFHPRRSSDERWEPARTGRTDATVFGGPPRGPARRLRRAVRMCRPVISVSYT